MSTTWTITRRAFRAGDQVQAPLPARTLRIINIKFTHAYSNILFLLLPFPTRQSHARTKLEDKNKNP